MLALHCVLKNNYSMSEVVTVAQSTMFALSDVVAVLTMGRIQNNGPGGSVPTGILIGWFALLLLFFFLFFIFLFFCRVTRMLDRAVAVRIAFREKKHLWMIDKNVCRVSNRDLCIDVFSVIDTDNR